MRRISLLCLAVCMVCGGTVAGADTLAGRVLDETGKAIGAARLWLAQGGDVRTAETDAEGRYAFTDVAVGVAHLVAHKASWALAGRTMFLAGDAMVDLGLTPGAGLLIKTVDEHAVPIAGVRVTWMDVNGQFRIPAEILNHSQFPSLRSDDQGLLTVTSLPVDGFARLRASNFRYADAHVDYLPVGEAVQTVVLSEGWPARGRIMHDGKAVPGATVSIYQVGPSGQKEFASGLSDPDGFFSLRVGEGDYFVAVRHPEFASPPARPLAIAAANPAPLNFELITPRVISGAVQLPDGEPCLGARLSFRIDDTVYEETLTDKAGRFTLRVPTPDGILHIAPPPGYITEVLADIPVRMKDAAAITLDPIQLQALPRITGIVYDQDNQPVRDAIVASTSLDAPVWAVPDEEGRFEIQLQYAPEETQVAFEVEHAKRFQRGGFTTNLRKPREQKVYLKPFEPDVAVKDPLPGTNDLSSLIGEPAPDLVCREWFNGDPVTLAEMTGGVVVLLFWGGFDASPAGIDQVEELRAIHHLYAPIGDVSIVGIHDSTSDPEEVEQYIHARGITFPVGVDSDRLETFDAYSINYIPQVVLVDKKGRVRHTNTNGRLTELIKALRRE